LAKKKRNKYLYHGSNNKHLEVLSPKSKSVRDEKEGPVVFATQRKGLAASFIPHVENMEKDDPIISVIERKPVIVIPNKRKFLKNDTGGALYKLRKTNRFKRTIPKNHSFSRYEWVARSKIKPLDKRVYDSSIDAMIDNGAIVYFVTRKQQKEYERLIENGKVPRSKLFSFFNKLTSENEKKGVLKKKKWWKK